MIALIRENFIQSFHFRDQKILQRVVKSLAGDPTASYKNLELEVRYSYPYYSKIPSTTPHLVEGDEYGVYHSLAKV